MLPRFVCFGSWLVDIPSARNSEIAAVVRPHIASPNLAPLPPVPADRQRYAALGDTSYEVELAPTIHQECGQVGVKFSGGNSRSCMTHAQKLGKHGGSVVITRDVYFTSLNRDGAIGHRQGCKGFITPKGMSIEFDTMSCGDHSHVTPSLAHRGSTTTVRPLCAERSSARLDNLSARFQ
jgi:hypothetical protein